MSAQILDLPSPLGAPWRPESTWPKHMGIGANEHVMTTLPFWASGCMREVGHCQAVSFAHENRSLAGFP